MPRDGRPADREPSGDLPGSELARPQVSEDLASGWVGERSEHTSLVICHYRYLATDLDTKQAGADDE